MKDQSDCVLNDLGELGGTEVFLKNQHNTEIFSFVLLLSPCFSSTFRQTNGDNTRNVSEDHLSVSRIQSLHHCLEVVLRVEEECLFFLPLGKA